ncbi:hypothetical protein ACFL3V_00500 [Nanoarchaeota archaeon]
MDLFPNNRKAQITIFIIIGIIIIFSVGIYSYVRSQGVSPAKMLQPKAPPVVQFIDACIDKTATEAIRAMGDQGGYISVPPELAFNPTRHLALAPGVGGEFSPKVPFWYYEGKTRIPSIEYIEHQVQEYVNINLAYCLNDFAEMRDEYDITELSNYTTDVMFADKDTLIKLKYRIDIQPKGSGEVTSREEFVVKLDVKFKRMWELAKEILEAENQRTFYENMTLNLMASHPSDDIPFTGLSLDCEKKIWLLSDIKKKLNRALPSAVAATRFQNTDHPPFKEKDDVYEAIHRAVEQSKSVNTIVAKKNKDGKITSLPPMNLPKNIPDDSYDWFQYYFRFTDEDYKDLKVMSTYKTEWGMRLLATPNQHGVLKAGVQDLKSKILSFLCLKTYHFVYDLTYPVMMNINDPEAFHRTGFVFRYAFPVQIFHNEPDRSLMPTVIIEPAEFEMDFCEFTSGDDHTIIARDAVTNAELTRVNITFRCLRESCHLGSTRSNNRHLQWSGKFPDGCVGPIIIADKPGYLETEKQHYGIDDPFFIDMFPTQSVKFDVKRHPQNAPGSYRMLEKDMYAIIQLESRDPPLAVFDVFDRSEMFNNTQEFELLRADATYDLNIMLLQKGAEDDVMIGGWMGEWSVKMEDMLDAEKVVFHVPQKYPPPKTQEEIMAVYELMVNRSIMPEAVPELIRSDEYTGEDEEVI